MSAKLIRLERWLEAHYDEPPSLETARRWIRAGKIQPPPERHGRAYFVHPDARYTDGPATLLDRIRADEAKALAH